MRIISFNANGLRSAASKGFFDWFRAAEGRRAVRAGNQGAGTPARRCRLPARRATRPGSGMPAPRRATAASPSTAEREPDEVRTALGWAPFDDEGRYLEARFGNLSVVSFYIPSGSSGEVRQGFKFEVMEWLQAASSTNGWPAAATTCCAATGTSCARAWTSRTGHRNQKNSGCLPPERDWINGLCVDDSGWVDAYRALHAEGQDYTWWSNRGAARANNVGWRIDYQIVTPSLRDKLEGLLDRAASRASPTTPRSPWTMSSDAAAAIKPARRAGAKSCANLRQPKVLVMLLLGFGSGLPLLPGRQHAGLLDARERHRAVDDRLPVVGRPGLFAEVPVGADRRQARRAGARALARPAARLDAAVAARGGRGLDRHGAGAARRASCAGRFASTSWSCSACWRWSSRSPRRPRTS